MASGMAADLIVALLRAAGVERLSGVAGWSDGTAGMSGICAGSHEPGGLHRADGCFKAHRGWNNRLSGAGVLLAVAVTTAGAETPLERGAYLVTTIGACGNCHSPVDHNGNRDGPALSGGPAILAPVFTAHPPNITSDVETGIGTWSEDQIVDALRNGRRPDGRILRPPMPVPFYRSLSDTDVHAIATYLRSLPPTANRVPASTYQAQTPASYGPPVVSVPEPDRTKLVAYGGYLANAGHCMLCHTPNGPDGQRDYVHRLGAGGFSVETANGVRVSANITSDVTTGIGSWSDVQITAALRHGVAADGSSLATIMPWPYLEGMKPDDLAALVAWLRSLPPIENVVVQ